MTSGRRPIIVALVLTVVMVAVLLSFSSVRDVLSAVLHGDLKGMRTRLDDLGWWAVLVLLALALLHVLIPFPAELPNAAAGFALGFWVGVPVMIVCWVVSGLAAYWLAREAGRPALTRLLGEERINDAERFVHNGGATGLIAVRLIPVVPFSLASFAAGLARVSVGRFTWTTAVGFLPLTAAPVLVGSRLRSPSLSDPLLWGPIVGALLLLLLLFVGRRIWDRDEAEPEPGDASVIAAPAPAEETVVD